MPPHDLRALMQPFATAIYAKARAVKTLDLSHAQQQRLRESISDDIKKASNFHPHKMSKAARAKAIELHIEGLVDKTWHDQHSFDPGREHFLVEHKVTVSSLREKCLQAADEQSVLTVLVKDICVVWILRDEDDRLTALKYRSKRPPTGYEEAQIEVWDGD